MVPRRLIAALALLVVGLLGVGVTAAVRRTNDNSPAVAAPRVSSSPTEDSTGEPVPTDPATQVPSPGETVAPVPSAPAPAGSTPPAAAGGSGSGSGSGGSPQALGPPAPSMPETGPITAVLFVAAISAFLAIVVHRRYFR